jgi:chaperone modulatory protein CbpM
MLIELDQLVLRVAGLDRAEVVRWVENRWVLPEHRHQTWLFREVDIARVELIHEIRRDFGIEDEAMSLVLGVLDQLYSLRRQMARLCAAVDGQPEDVREAIRRALPPTDTDKG